MLDIQSQFKLWNKKTDYINFEGILNISNEILAQLSLQNKHLKFERNSKGELIVMAPTKRNTGRINSIINMKLGIWNEEKKAGVCFDSSTGFELPNSAIRSPDVSWMTIEKWGSLTDEEKNSFGPLVPDFVIEIKSISDSLKSQQEKMIEWIDNGIKLAWLIDPTEEKVYIYKNNGSVETIESFEHKLSGEDILPDFVFDLSLLNDLE